jgi:signal transduction histidine kinase/CheY-like chemotaxis protein
LEKEKNLIKRYIISEELPLNLRILNLVCFCGFFAALVSTSARIIEQVPFYSVLTMLLMMVMVLIAFLFINHYARFHRLAVILTLVLLGDVLFPIIFFVNGGLNSGMPAYFALSLLLVFLLATGVDRVVMLALNIGVILFCYTFGVFSDLADSVVELTTIQRVIDCVQSLLVTGFFFGLVIIFQNRIYLKEKSRVEEQNEMLLHQDKLLKVVNNAASDLLTAGEQTFERDVTNSMRDMCFAVGADRMIIWRNAMRGGKLCYVRHHAWEKEELAQRAEAMQLKDGDHFTYMDSIPEWEEEFRHQRWINGPVRSLSLSEQSALAPYGIASILVFPIFIQDQFWGFTSFDDCYRERRYSDSEVGVLFSASLMLVNAIIRSGDEITMRERLAQQEMMSVITQSFIATNSLDETIEGALEKLGTSLAADRVLVITADEETQMTSPAYIWYADPAYKPLPSETGLAALILEQFPEEMPKDGFIPTFFVNDVSEDQDGKYAVFASKVDVRSFVWAPLYVSGRYWGLLCIEQCRYPRPWSAGEVQLTSTAGSAISGAIARSIIEKERENALNAAISASQAKGNFLSNMSHEIRTPMNAIIGMTTIGKSADNLERKDYAFGKIEEASTHLLGVINDILDMSKIEAGKLELAPVRYNFEKMLQRVVSVIMFPVEEKDLRLSVYIDSNLPRYLVGDDQRLNQVITNLLSNAVKFTPSGGSIKLGAYLEEDSGGEITLRVIVSDTGIGISPEQQARLFTSFEQAESGTSRKFGGTGLGLAISKRIVNLMGGDIWIQSALGEGSTFIFTVRVEKSEDQEEGQTGPSIFRKQHLRALVVDDEPGDLQYFTEIAGRLRFNCDTAPSGEAAIEKIKEEGPYDIYFIDMKMPGMSGLQLSKKVREELDKEAVITIISAYEWNRIEEEAKSAGVDRFLPKPIFPSGISDLLAECFGQPMNAKLDDTPHEDRTDMFKGRYILLAEDVEINREILIALLADTAIQIDCAENGIQAVEMFGENPDRYEMIFMDMQMPEMDGLEATRLIRAKASGIPHAGTIPIIAMTANVMREDIERCLDAGMNDHIGKPLDLSDVLAKLQLWLPAR